MKIDWAGHVPNVQARRTLLNLEKMFTGLLFDGGSGESLGHKFKLEQGVWIYEGPMDNGDSAAHVPSAE